MNTPYGQNIKLYIEGGSHDEKIVMRLLNLPAGVKIDTDRLQAFMDRRAPGRDQYSTARYEPDKPIFTSGIIDGVTDGNPIEAEIYNYNQRPSDYDFNDTPRPSHADYAAVMKYGNNVDLRGGGHFSGRLTAPYCIAGGICLQYLDRLGIHVFSHIYSIGSIYDAPFDMANVGENEYQSLSDRPFRVLDTQSGERMKALIDSVKSRGDSIGGIIECAIINLPAGLGEHMFNSVEAALSCAVFGIPAVKGIEFGSGFLGSTMLGSQNNDPFQTDGKAFRTLTNNSGGILGGMSDGMPVIFRAAVKPTPSISLEQNTVSLSRKENVKLKISGRHDPCIVPRAIPAIEAAAAVAIVDLLAGEN